MRHIADHLWVASSFFSLKCCTELGYHPNVFCILSWSRMFVEYVCMSSDSCCLQVDIVLYIIFFYYCLFVTTVMTVSKDYGATLCRLHASCFVQRGY